VGPSSFETSLPVYQCIGHCIPEGFEIETAVRTLISRRSRVLRDQGTEEKIWTKEREVRAEVA